jgi:hypothetical protein
MYQATGTIKVIFDTQTFPSGFTKREFVITTGDENYPQDIKFELVKDKCEWLDTYQDGQEVTVNFDVRGNEYKEKYYVNLNAWKIESAEQQEQPAQPQGNQHQAGGHPLPQRTNTQLQDVNQPAQNISGAGEVLENDQVPF